MGRCWCRPPGKRGHGVIFNPDHKYQALAEVAGLGGPPVPTPPALEHPRAQSSARGAEHPPREQSILPRAGLPLGPSPTSSGCPCSDKRTRQRYQFMPCWGKKKGKSQLLKIEGDNNPLPLYLAPPRSPKRSIRSGNYGIAAVLPAAWLQEEPGKKRPRRDGADIQV